MSAAAVHDASIRAARLPVFLRALVNQYGPEGGLRMVLQPDTCADIITDPGYRGPNRNVNSKRVEHYARTLREGRWRYNGEAVKFTRSGALADGQHRLNASVASDQPLDTMVIWGIAEDAQDTMDTGKVRTAGDVLAIHGFTGSTTNLAAVARLLIQFESGTLGRGTRGQDLTADEILHYCRCNPDAAAAVQELGRIPVPVRLTVYLAAYVLFMRIDPDDAARFNVAFVRGTGLERGNPILTLRERFQRSRADHDRLTPYVELAALLRTWNSWRKGDTLARVVLVKDGLPIIVPERLR